MKELVGRRIVSKDGACYTVKEWYRGWLPGEGKLIYGWSGKETEVDTTKIRPIKIIYVEDEQGKVQA